MTEQAQQQQATPSSGTGTGGDTRARVERLLTDILGLMGFPARMEFQDASGISHLHAAGPSFVWADAKTVARAAIEGLDQGKRARARLRRAR